MKLNYFNIIFLLGYMYNCWGFWSLLASSNRRYFFLPHIYTCCMRYSDVKFKHNFYVGAYVTIRVF